MKNGKNIKYHLPENPDSLQQGFSVPDGYFEQLPEKVLHRIASLPDFEKTAATNPFTVPEHYFESLQENVHNRIAAQKQNILERWFQKSNPDWRFKPAYAVLFACFLLLAIAGTEYMRRPVAVESYASNEIQLSPYDLYDIDESLIIDVFYSNGNTANESSADIDYLLDNDIDINSITEQL